MSCTLAQTQGTSTAHMIKRLPSRLAECNSQCACVLHSAVCFAPPWTARRQREPSRRVCSEFRKSKRSDPLSLQHITRVDSRHQASGCTPRDTAYVPPGWVYFSSEDMQSSFQLSFVQTTSPHKEFGGRVKGDPEKRHAVDVDPVEILAVG